MYVKQKLTLYVIYQSLSPVKTIINFAKCNDKYFESIISSWVICATYITLFL